MLTEGLQMIVQRLTEMKWSDYLDIILVAYLFYRLLPLIHDDDHYTVQMAMGWLIAELAVFEPEAVWTWLSGNGLRYNINGKAIQKICDSFRICQPWKERFKALRPALRERM